MSLLQGQGVDIKAGGLGGLVAVHEEATAGLMTFAPSASPTPAPTGMSELPKESVDCAVNEWSGWSECHYTCSIVSAPNGKGVLVVSPKGVARRMRTVARRS